MDGRVEGGVSIESGTVPLSVRSGAPRQYSPHWRGDGVQGGDDPARREVVGGDGEGRER